MTRGRSLDAFSRSSVCLSRSRQAVARADPRLWAVLREGDALANFLKPGARAHYGSDSEKLVEFGVQPFRGRSKKKVTEPPPLPETVAPSESAIDTVE